MHSFICNVCAKSLAGIGVNLEEKVGAEGRKGGLVGKGLGMGKGEKEWVGLSGIVEEGKGMRGRLSGKRIEE